jgi:hypothetical protein
MSPNTIVSHGNLKAPLTTFATARSITSSPERGIFDVETYRFLMSIRRQTHGSRDERRALVISGLS